MLIAKERRIIYLDSLKIIAAWAAKDIAMFLAIVSIVMQESRGDMMRVVMFASSSLLIYVGVHFHLKIMIIEIISFIFAWPGNSQIESITSCSLRIFSK